MRRRRIAAWMLALAALCLLAVGASACGGGSDEGTGGSGTAGEPVSGGTLNVAFQGEPTGLDPAVAWEIKSWSIEHCIFNQLLSWEAGPGEAKVAPDIATEVPTVENGGITNDGKTYTYHLRKGVMFQAPVSREVTADDFKWSFERMMNPKEVPLAPAGYLYEGVKGVSDFVDGKAKEITGYKVIDDHTIQIDLTEPNYVFNMVMAQPFAAVMAKEWVSKYNDRTIMRHPLGTGPFVFDHWKNGQEIVLTKNPDYFDTGKPYLDEIDFQFAASASTAVLQLQRGDVDVLGSGIPSAEYVRLSNDPKWKEQIYTAPQVAWYYVFMNVNVKPFDDVKVRQAINYAIDTAKIQKLLYGQAEALNQVYPKGMSGYVEGAQFYSHDPEKAKQLLAEAGFPDGFEVTFYCHNIDPMPKLAQSIQNDLAQVGIKAGIKQMADSPYWNLISRMDADIPIGLSDWYMDFPDPSDWIGPLFSKDSAETDGGANACWWWSQEVEDLYKQSMPMEPGAERTKLYEQMQDVIMEEAPTAPLFQPIQTTMASAMTGGFYTSAMWTFDFPSYWKTNGQ